MDYKHRIQISLTSDHSVRFYSIFLRQPQFISGHFLGRSTKLSMTILLGMALIHSLVLDFCCLMVLGLLATFYLPDSPYESNLWNSSLVSVEICLRTDCAPLKLIFGGIFGTFQRCEGLKFVCIR